MHEVINYLPSAPDWPQAIEVRFYLSRHDWCELQKKECWTQVAEYLAQLETKHNQSKVVI